MKRVRSDNDKTGNKMLFNDATIAACMFYEERKAYLEADEMNLDFDVLSLLDSLGISINCMGTYLYKMLIVKIIELFELGFSEEEIHEQVNDPYSQLYFDIARNDLDLGLKTFHSSIEDMLCGRFAFKSTDVVEDVFPHYDKNLNYGEQAILIAKYVMENYIDEEKDKEKEEQTFLKKVLADVII